MRRVRLILAAVTQIYVIGCDNTLDADGRY